MALTPPTPPRADERPTVCPVCKSTDLTSASKTIDASTYWNCRTCGEVWNVARRREISRSNVYRW